MIQFLLLFLLTDHDTTHSASVLYNFSDQRNDYSRKINIKQSHDISNTRSRLLVTMVIDLSTYDQSIHELYNSFDEINKVINVLVNYYDVPLKDKYFQIFKGLKTDN